MSARRSRRPSGSSELTGSSRISRLRLARRAPARSRAAGASRPSSRRSDGRAASARPTSSSVSVGPRSRRRARSSPCSRPASTTSSRPGHPAVVARVLVEDADRAPRARVARSTGRRRSRPRPPVGRASPVMSRSVVVLPVMHPQAAISSPVGSSASSTSSATCRGAGDRPTARMALRTRFLSTTAGRSDTLRRRPARAAAR